MPGPGEVAPEREIAVAFFFKDLGLVCLGAAVVAIVLAELGSPIVISGFGTGSFGVLFFWLGWLLHRELGKRIEDIDDVPEFCRDRV